MEARRIAITKALGINKLKDKQFEGFRHARSTLVRSTPT